MSLPGESVSPGLVARWKIELAVAVLLAAFALLAIADALRIGAGWASDGPGPGFFPFYVGLILLAAAVSTAIGALRPRHREAGAFVSREGFGSVLAVLGPATLFVVGAIWIGIYVAAAILIATFMRWRGGYSLGRSAGLAILLSLAIFAIFELWFLMPLPKGPLEAALGF